MCPLRIISARLLPGTTQQDWCMMVYSLKVSNKIAKSWSGFLGWLPSAYSWLTIMCDGSQPLTSLRKILVIVLLTATQLQRLGRQRHQLWTCRALRPRSLLWISVSAAFSLAAAAWQQQLGWAPYWGWLAQMRRPDWRRGGPRRLLKGLGYTKRPWTFF